MSRWLPEATTYRLTVIGASRPTSIVSSPEESGTHPDPGRQFLGEWGALPVRCERKPATNRYAACPVDLQSPVVESQYTRFRISSALRTSRTSCSITPVCASCQFPSVVGIPSSGRLGGMNSGRTALYKNAVCKTKSAVTMRAAGDFKNLSKTLLLRSNRLLVDAWVNEVDQQVHHYHHGERDHKNDPALRLVKESLRKTRINFAEQAGEGYAGRVRNDRDGNGSDQQHPAHPDLTVEKVSVYQGQE